MIDNLRIQDSVRLNNLNQFLDGGHLALCPPPVHPESRRINKAQRAHHERTFMIFSRKKLAIVCILSLFFQSTTFAGWQKLAQGLEYQAFQAGAPTPWSRVHTFRVNLKYNQLKSVLAKDLGKKEATIQDFARSNVDAMVTINGGFFDEAYQPLGLRIQQNKQTNPLKRISWWGLFFIKNNQAQVSSLHDFLNPEGIEFAVQSGPRLLINGTIPRLKPGSAQRSALGIRKDGRVIIVITDNNALSTLELAEFMQAPPLNCVSALNLDGGGSSQLAARVGSFQLSVPGFAKLADAIVIVPN